VYSFDASSIIHAWDNYPIENEHFESLWFWLAEKIEEKEFTISEIALKEVTDKIPECGKWLKDHNAEVYKLSPSALHKTQEIKTLLGIEEDEYGNGVGEKDLFIVAIAKESNLTLVTEESRQNNLPTKKHNYKIPAVCALPEINVDCIYFVDLIK